MKARCSLLMLAVVLIAPICFSAQIAASPAQVAVSPAQVNDASVKSLPGLCWEPCMDYYLSCLGDDPTPIQQGICRSDFDFCLGTWPACVPPVG